MLSKPLGTPAESFQGEDVSQLTYPQNLCVPQLVSSRAATSPNALAVRHGRLSLTYRELEVRATQLAHLLRSLGVCPEVIVGLCMKRSLAMIVGALAILKAGGAYLPLDPNYPTRRLAFLLEDAQAPILLIGQGMVNELPVRPKNVITLDPEGRLAIHGNFEPFATKVTGENLAYIIYTSGSTGQPKGVEITHASLLNLVFWHQRTFGVTPDDRASQLSALAFDAAVWEIWSNLTAGASLHLPDGLDLKEPESVRDWLVSERITISFLPTPLAERLITLNWPAKSTLRVMLTGADTLHHYPSRKLRFQLVNNYGPTECTVVTTSGTVFPNDHPSRPPAIGRPITNTKIYILNEKMQQVPINEPGEIYIEGAGLARGYLNRPDLTANRFVPNPFSSEMGARLYRTGDVARSLPDGQIAFLGRLDEQIKIRGFRIEPAEIVAMLDEHPAVKASIVIAREIEPGDMQLVAYFVSTAKTQPTLAELRNFIAHRLPDYMVPAIFVKMDVLPLNPSGKADRGALPMPNVGNTLRDDAFVPPRTPTEKSVTKFLATFLGLEQVSTEDNFFLLGGHSLMGAQLVVRIRDMFGVELSLRSLFDAPTVAKLAALIDSALHAKREVTSDGEDHHILEAAAGKNPA